MLTRRQLMFAGVAATATLGIWSRSSSAGVRRACILHGATVTAPAIGSLRIGHAIVAVTVLAYTVLRLHSRTMTVTTPAESDREKPSMRNEHEEHV